MYITYTEKEKKEWKKILKEAYILDVVDKAFKISYYSCIQI